MADGRHIEKWKIGLGIISTNAKACSCQKVPYTEQAKVELYATLSTLSISPYKTPKILKTKTGFSFCVL